LCGTAALWIAPHARRVEIGGEVFLEVVVARHRVPVAALLASRTHSRRFCVKTSSTVIPSAAPIQAATCTGWTAPIDATPALAHQARNSSAARALARRVCGLRMLAAKNSRKRIEALSPALTSAGTWPRAVANGIRLEFTPKAPAERCGIIARAVRRDGSA
jgi:hypothetical protein